MRARAVLVAALDDRGRTVARRLRSQSPLRLVPRLLPGGPLLVHVVSSATAPLGGDELSLRVLLEPGARVALRGVGATLALPDAHGRDGTSEVDVELGDGAALSYLPEPTVVTARGRLTTHTRVAMAADARLELGETLVVGRHHEDTGRLAGLVEIECGGRGVYRQTIHLGEPELSGTLPYLWRNRVIASRWRIGPDLPAAALRSAADEWWQLSPLECPAGTGGHFAQAVGLDASTTLARLDAALHAAEAKEPVPEFFPDLW